MTAEVDTLKNLHLALVESLNGYKEALSAAESKSLGQMFQEMIVLRTHDAEEVASTLKFFGEEVDQEGSLTNAVQMAVSNVLSIFSGFDDSILPGLIDGERRILNYYDQALGAAPVDGPERAILIQQRTALETKIAQMNAAAQTHA